LKKIPKLYIAFQFFSDYGKSNTMSFKQRRAF